MKIKILRTMAMVMLSVAAIESASAQPGIRFERSEVTLEPGQAYLAPDVGTIGDHLLAPNSYVLRYQQPGNALLNNLRMSVNREEVEPGGIFSLHSPAALGISFSVAENASPGDSTVVAEVYDLAGDLMGTAFFKVRVRWKSRSCLMCLRASDGMSHVASEADEGSVNANRPWCLDFEVHQLTDFNGEALTNGDFVGIQSWHGKYWSAQPSGELVADRSALLPWEIFQVRKIDADVDPTISGGDSIALKSFHGDWLVAVGGGGDAVAANSPIQSDWETFTFSPGVTRQFCLRAANSRFVASETDQMSVTATRERCSEDSWNELIDIDGADLLSGDIVYIRSRHGRFWSAQPEGSLDANRINAGPWERFKLVKVSGSPGPVITAGSRVALQTYHGRWIVAEGGGGGEVAANRDQALAWETFVIFPLNGFGTQGDCGVLRNRSAPFLVGCVGECAPDIEEQIKIDTSTSATSCTRPRGGCALELTVLETMCPSDVGRVELIKNGIPFAVYDVRGPFEQPSPERVTIEASLEPGDVLTVRVTDVILEGLGPVCKRLGNFRFELSILR